MAQVYSVFLSGLEDYTVNERGDVGSWVRLACIQGLGSIIDALMQHAEKLASSNGETTEHDNHDQGFAAFLPIEAYHTIIAGILKQGVERLDNVRLLAGKTFDRLLKTDPPRFSKIPRSEAWKVSGYAHFKELLVS